MIVRSLRQPLWILFFVLFAGQQAIAQVDTISPQHHPLHTSWLQPGLRQYLVYFQFPDKPKLLNFSLWMREVIKNQDVFEVKQTWYNADTNYFKTFYSINRASDFSPLYHSETGHNGQKAYDWSATGVKAADTVAFNKAAPYQLDFDGPNYNWHLDIETFEMLPLAAGKTFYIRFYDAGLDPPAYVKYTVTGSELLTTLDNRQVDCWMLQITGKAPQGFDYVQTFWISKAGHEFLKEVDSYNGVFRYKIKLPGLTPNLPEVLRQVVFSRSPIKLPVSPRR
ncbi:hypothetical protein [Chitinophaga qingshengii]|uniref:Uncharacterized protein n=1 Tax=Chitinophaga qingshengii TaxID=1569794 RepID=A0ABR7TKG9_9BACT|nr:hypothetical protein [Chitinophaga qingshengii]MBC9930028.1 hypothetical protein [Chitinophaga qingshengii]